ncbi:MAG: MATE family efflux transporter [Bacteroidales bacterium]|nr:MATE family efflux transporter [Bacteroidales bacterium]
MTESPVHQLVMKMAVPTIISMMVTALYNIIDAFFVGHISTEATAGVGVSFAYMTFINAVGFFFGHGSGNYISTALGAKKYADAEKMASTGFLSSMGLGTVAAIVGLFFLTPLSRMMGATPDIVPYSNDYMLFILIGTPFMMSSLTLNNQLRLQGNAHYAMVGIATGAVLNIFLDALLIYVLDMGVTGASLATCISQMAGWFILLLGTEKSGNVHIRFRNFTLSWQSYKDIFKGGNPSLCRHVFVCVSTIMLNRYAAFYAAPGTEASAIAAFAIVARIMMFAFSIILGVGQGFQPVCGFNYGAGLHERVRKSYIFTTQLSTIILIIISITFAIFAPDLIKIFRGEDAELIKIGTRVLRWQCLSFPLIGVSTVTNMMYQTTRKTLIATILSMGRQGVFFIPTIMILPLFIGLQGVEMTQAISDACTFLLALPFAIKESRDSSLRSE